MTKNYKANIKLCILVILLSVCFVQPEVWAKTTQLIVGLDNEVERLIPIKIKSPQSLPVSMQIYQGLFDLDEEGKLIPQIIEKYETKDFKRWIFHVRRGVYFHKSKIFKNMTREVTADDVLYSLTRFSSSESFGAFVLTDSIKGAREYNQGKINFIEGLKIIDKFTLQIELIQPERFFLNRLSTAWISVFPREQDKKELAEKVGFSIAIGTGPYMLVSKTENEVTLIKNPNYWDSKNKPQIEKLIFKIIKNDQVRLINLLRGKIDLMFVPTSLFSNVFQTDGTLKDEIKKRYQIKMASTYNAHFIGINNKKILDVNLRRAMFWGTNRKEMIQAILYGNGEPMAGIVPEGMNGYKGPFSGDVFDPEKAKDFLKKSSYNGEPLELLVHDIANSEQIGQIFQAQMANIGINIKLIKMDFGSVIQRILSGENSLFNMFIEWVYSSPEPILINTFSSSKIPVPNFFAFSNPEVDQMLETLRNYQDDQTSVKFCSDIEAKAMNYAPMIPLYRQKYIVLYPKDMIGLEINGNNHYFFEKIRLKS